MIHAMKPVIYSTYMPTDLCQVILHQALLLGTPQTDPDYTGLEFPVGCQWQSFPTLQAGVSK